MACAAIARPSKRAGSVEAHARGEQAEHVVVRPGLADQGDGRLVHQPQMWP